MTEALKTFTDFKTILQEYIEQRGHICKFHCELSPIECVWCQSKKHTRAFADGTITRLRRIVLEQCDCTTNKEILQDMPRL